MQNDCQYCEVCKMIWVISKKINDNRELNFIYYGNGFGIVKETVIKLTKNKLKVVNKMSGLRTMVGNRNKSGIVYQLMAMFAIPNKI